MPAERKGFLRGLVDKVTGADSFAIEDANRTGMVGENGRPGFFERLKAGLTRSHENLVGRIDVLLQGKKQIDADTLEQLEEILITADIGLPTTLELIRNLEQRLGRNELLDAEARRGH